LIWGNERCATPLTTRNSSHGSRERGKIANTQRSQNSSRPLVWEMTMSQTRRVVFTRIPIGPRSGFLKSKDGVGLIRVHNVQGRCPHHQVECVVGCLTQGVESGSDGSASKKEARGSSSGLHKLCGLGCKWAQDDNQDGHCRKSVCAPKGLHFPCCTVVVLGIKLRRHRREDPESSRGTAGNGL
jgi:hypothetical protein